MLQKHAEPHIDPENPWEGDKLGREDIAKYLTPFLTGVTQPFVIGLNAPYGTGKTNFIKRWGYALENEGYYTAYFNAWETDFSDDALTAFMANLKNQIEINLEGKKQSKVVAERFVKLPNKLAPFLRDRALPLGLKGLTRFLSGDTGLEEIEDELAAFAEEFSTQALRQQEKADCQLGDFRDYLEKTIKEATKYKRADQKKIIVFVDDLDRCRPPYAIQVLEAIKHFFAVEGLVFVLAVDDAQIKAAIKCQYGEIDQDGYLDKFIDWRFTLPEPDTYKYCDFLAEKFGFKDLPVFSDKARTEDIMKQLNDWGVMVKSFANFAIAYDFSLRKIERCFTQLNLALRTLDDNDVVCSAAMGGILAIKEKHPEECHKLCLDVEYHKTFPRPDVTKNVRSPIDNLDTSKVIEIWLMNINDLNELLQRPSNQSGVYAEARCALRVLENKGPTTVAKIVYERLNAAAKFLPQH